jgi:hypothetical protein
MKTIKILATIVFIFLCCLFVKGQERTEPKKIQVNGDYVHKMTQTVFPEQFDKYTRHDIFSFDKKNNNIGVVYGNEQNNQKTTISIYIYPAGDGVEGRLRNEYFRTMQSIAIVAKKGLGATQFAVRYKGEKYICNGYKAILNTDLNEYNQISLYECGTWFFKVRLTTKYLDTTQISNIEKTIFEIFDPSKLTALKPLDPKASVYFSKTAFKDSVLIGSAMGSALEKINWAIKNVNENERASGFPDLYLNMHIEALKAFAKFEKEHNFFKSEETKKYLTELNSIIDAGYLAEFILEQYGNIMIVPKNMEVNFEGYYKWKQTHQLTLDLSKKYYALEYGQN